MHRSRRERSGGTCCFDVIGKRCCALTNPPNSSGPTMSEGLSHYTRKCGRPLRLCDLICNSQVKWVHLQPGMVGLPVWYTRVWGFQKPQQIRIQTAPSTRHWQAQLRSSGFTAWILAKDGLLCSDGELDSKRDEPGRRAGFFASL